MPLMKEVIGMLNIINTYREALEYEKFLKSVDTGKPIYIPTKRQKYKNKKRRKNSK